MLIENETPALTIIAAQIVKVFYPFILARTETGQYLHLQLSDREQQDPLFWDSLRSILRAHLWVPIGQHYHQLLDDGWLQPTTVDPV